ncbi:MAG: response regulator [Bacteroidia bacterium]
MRTIKVLIVEDEMIVAKDISYYLEELGCEVCGLLMEGEQVLPFLEKEVPDIILMDIMLKGKLDGVIYYPFDQETLFDSHHLPDRQYRRSSLLRWQSYQTLRFHRKAV